MYTIYICINTYIKTNLKSNIFLQILEDDSLQRPFRSPTPLRSEPYLKNLESLQACAGGWLSSLDVGKDIGMYPPWNYCWWFRNPTNSPVWGKGIVTIPLLFSVFIHPFPVVGNGISEPSTVTWGLGFVFVWCLVKWWKSHPMGSILPSKNHLKNIEKRWSPKPKAWKCTSRQVDPSIFRCKRPLLVSGSRVLKR